MPRKKVLARWEGRLGIWPDVVWYGERPEKGYVCYTRVYSSAKRNWVWRSCKMKVRNELGALDPAAQSRVLQMAKERHDLVTGRLGEDVAPMRGEAITIARTWPILTNAEMGRFPNKTLYRQSLHAALNDAAGILGSHFAWLHFTQAQLIKVTRGKVIAVRRKKKDVTGFRSACELGTAMITIMGILREDGYVPREVTIPGGRRWRQDLKRYVAELDGGREPEPKRPRYTLDELRRLHVAAYRVDPRFGLLVDLAGTGLRGGQVVRAMRSNFDLEKGIFRVPGLGKKMGAIVELTPGQHDALKAAVAPGGYLAPLEGSRADYFMFPMGMLVLVGDGERQLMVVDPERQGSAGHLNRRTLVAWQKEAESLAVPPIAHVAGRSFYGMKRQTVDKVTEDNISTEGLTEVGGWASERVPQTIYRDKERPKARHEAMLARARVRGENIPDSYPAPEMSPNRPTEEPA